MYKTHEQKQAGVVLLVRAFAHGYVTGILDQSVDAGDDKRRPQTVKRLMLDHYGHFFTAFAQTSARAIADVCLEQDKRATFDRLARLADGHSPSDGQDEKPAEAEADARRYVELLGRACGNHPTERLMIEEYKFQFDRLLKGRPSDVEEQKAHIPAALSSLLPSLPDGILRTAYHILAQAYTRGLTDAARQRHDPVIRHRKGSLNRLCIGMAELICHDVAKEDFDASALSLPDRLLRKACRSQAHYEMIRGCLPAGSDAV